MAHLHDGCLQALLLIVQGEKCFYAQHPHWVVNLDDLIKAMQTLYDLSVSRNIPAVMDKCVRDSIDPILVTFDPGDDRILRVQLDLMMSSLNFDTHDQLHETAMTATSSDYRNCEPLFAVVRDFFDTIHSYHATYWLPNDYGVTTDMREQFQEYLINYYAYWFRQQPHYDPIEISNPINIEIQNLVRKLVDTLLTDPKDHTDPMTWEVNLLDL